MKALALALALIAATSGLAVAGLCQDELKKVDAALASQELPPEQRAQAEDMRNQALQLCGAGNEQEGVDVLTEAKAMLGVE
jgi:hypothetical protein